MNTVNGAMKGAWFTDLPIGLPTGCPCRSRRRKNEMNQEDIYMNSLETIVLNGVEYVRKADVDVRMRDYETDHVIVIAQRGWIFEGCRDKSITDKIRLINANVVRSWTNGRGIGGLAKEVHKDEYTLDHVGIIEIPPQAIIGIINIEW